MRQFVSLTKHTGFNKITPCHAKRDWTYLEPCTIGREGGSKAVVRINARSVSTSPNVLTAEAIGIQCYFARPYASWQRGTNESVNGLVRRYFPKGTDFSKITDGQVAMVESLINNRPRKGLAYKTPLEVASAFVALRP